ncbi:MAG: RdgB/HAM1 family non-canonical purine NTP pyrophosphatase [Oligoflexales bacterium]
MQRQKVFLATSNDGKKREFGALLPHSLGWDLHLCSELGKITWDENGSSYAENAMIKAKAVKEKTEFGVIADDSGLEVDFLDGKPGVHSARFAGDHSTDEQNNDKLLELLKGVPSTKRTARFVCTLVFVDSKGICYTASGKCEGVITTLRRGSNGFGYDPIFEVSGMNRTMAELGNDEKDRLSHRATAVNELVQRIGTE